MRRKYYSNPVSEPEDLQQFEGWEVRKIHTRDRPGIILQNPDSGQKVKLVLSQDCFNDNRIKVSRKMQILLVN